MTIGRITLTPPSIERRSVASSADISSYLRAIRTDLLTAFKGLQNLNERELSFIRALNFQNQAITQHEFVNYSLGQAILAAFSVGSDTKLLYSNFWTNADIFNVGSLKHDAAHGQITLKSSNSWSHIPVIRNSSGRLTPVDSVVVHEFKTADPVIMTTVEQNGLNNPVSRPNEIYNAFNRSPLDVFLKTWTTSEFSNDSRYYIQVNLPTSINPSVNTLIIHPFPYYVWTILDARIQTNPGTWETITGFNLAGTLLSNIHHSFETTDYANKLLIKMKPSNELLSEQLDSVRVLGFQNIDIGFTEYQSEGSAVIRMRAPTAEINSMRSFSADFSLHTTRSLPIHNYISFEVFRDSELTIKVYDSRTNVYPLTENDIAVDVQQSGSPIEELWVRVNMSRIQTATPILRSIQITYT